MEIAHHLDQLLILFGPICPRSCSSMRFETDTILMVKKGSLNTRHWRSVAFKIVDTSDCYFHSPFIIGGRIGFPTVRPAIRRSHRARSFGSQRPRSQRATKNAMITTAIEVESSIWTMDTRTRKSADSIGKSDRSDLLSQSPYITTPMRGSGSR